MFVRVGAGRDTSHETVPETVLTNVRATYRFLSAALASALTLAACGGDSPTEASSHVGLYIMQSAAGQLAPAVIHSLVDDQTGKPIEVFVVGDTLELKDDGTYVQRAQLEARIGGQVAGRSRWTDRGFYSKEGSAVHFDSDYLQNVAFSGALSAGPTLTVTQNLAGEGTDDVYVLKRAR
jgi:hypothetical protein